MEQVINNKELKKLFVELNDIVESSKKIQEKIQKLSEEQKSLGYKSNKIKEKMNPIMKEVTKELALDEYIVISGVSLKDGKVVATIVDAVEDFKEEFKKRKAEFESLETKTEEGLKEQTKE